MQRPGWGTAHGKATVNVVFVAVVGLAAAGTVGFRAVFAGAKGSPPPGVTVAFPASSGSYNTAGWTAGCGAAGLCGSASDKAGIAQVQLSLQQASTGGYWNGSGFSATAQTFVSAVLTAPGAASTSWSYGIPASSFPADGGYTATVRATDSPGRSSTATVSFTIDRAAPSAPVLTQTPEDPTFSTSATFSFTDADSTATFECSLDGAAFSACSSGTGYGNLSVSTHTFAVRAVDPAGNRSVATPYSWTIVPHGSFPVSGTLGSPFYPGGPAVPIDLSISNPYNFTLKVTGVTVSITGTSSAACSTANFTVVQNLATSVQIPAEQTLSLSQLGVAQSLWPQVAMRDTGTNQDACKRATVSFSFAGSGTKANQ